ncbi:hypothetical protein E2C01_068029 [Portunus trituberculatus]|uniref:Uncharacterized protein n=1 Tax=Portunus trituberculatus TaxID=210409 RepID=A0A5B7HUQ0_PORTR|nr:hypothetical protein [Portunus trituberculatus]
MWRQVISQHGEVRTGEKFGDGIQGAGRWVGVVVGTKSEIERTAARKYELQKAGFFLGIQAGVILVAML